MVNASQAGYKTQFLKKGSAGFILLISWSTNSLSKCICQDILYWPGNKTLQKTPDGTPKEWSIPINRVDNAAYHHDLCYSKHDYTKTRNEVCDKTMLDELSSIVNPTLRERIDKAIVENSSKLKLIMGWMLLIKKIKIY